MSTAEPTIDRILRDFFTARRRGAVGPNRDRIDLVEAQLRAFAEEREPLLVCAEHRLVLDLERQFGMPNPVARFLGPDALLSLLVHFVDRGVILDESPQWRLEFRLVDELLGCLLDRGLLGGNDVFLILGLQRDLRRARSLRSSGREPRR